MHSAASQQASLSTIGQIAITVQDVQRATDFYRDTLGMQHLFSAGSMSFFDCDGIRLLLGLPEPGQQAFSSIIYFRVPDIATAHDALVARGVQFVQTPHVAARMQTHDLWLAFLHDSEGNTLGLMSEVKR